MPKTKSGYDYAMQESEGEGGDLHPQMTFFVPELARFGCQVNGVIGAPRDTAVTLRIGSNSHLTFHGSLADLRRLSELIRTTLDEWEGK